MLLQQGYSYARKTICPAPILPNTCGVNSSFIGDGGGCGRFHIFALDLDDASTNGVERFYITR